jgi:hypothetical protein
VLSRGLQGGTIPLLFEIRFIIYLLVEVSHFGDVVSIINQLPLLFLERMTYILYEVFSGDTSASPVKMELKRRGLFWLLA